MSNEATRRFLDLKVNEVSLVDTPANELEFLVAKRHDNDEETQMTVKASAQEAAPGDATEVATVTIDTEAVAKAEGAAVKSALDQVNALVEGISKAIGAAGPGESDEGDADEGESEESDDDDSEDVAKSARTAFEGGLKSAGVTGAKLKKAMSGYDKNVAKRFETKVAKSKAAAVDAEEATIAGVLDTIHKAKAMTPSRVAKLQEAVETLQKLMMEVIGVGQSPSVTKVPAVRTHSNPNTTRSALVGTEKSAVLKSLDALVAKLDGLTGEAAVEKSAGADVDMTAVVERLEAISKRVDAITKARPASNAEGDATTTTATKTEAIQKKFWSGVL